MKTKILVTAPNLITGGAEKQLIYLIQGLAKRDFDITLLLLEREGEYTEDVPDEVKIISPSSPRPGKPFKFFWKMKEIISAIRREKPDILYSRLWPSKVATAFSGFLLRKKVVFSEDRSLRRLTRGNGKLSFDGYIKKLASHLAELTVPVSQGIADELLSIFELPPHKVKLIYNGFDFEKMRNEATEEVNHPWLDREIPVVGALGRMVELKGFDYLLESIMIVKDEGIPVKLIMIGKGEYLENLKTKASGLGIDDDVDFVGFVDNPFAYLARCDLFVLSSLYEGLPSTLIEAMALGLPVISTRCPTGPEEIIEDGRNGILVPVEDSRAIAEAVKRVLKNEELRSRLGNEARKRADYFSLENLVNRFAEMFREVSNN